MFQYKTLPILEYLVEVVFTLSRYEFFEKIDLSSFLEESRQTQASYTLHAVLVHSGKWWAVLVSLRSVAA